MASTTILGGSRVAAAAPTVDQRHSTERAGGRSSAFVRSATPAATWHRAHESAPPGDSATGSGVTAQQLQAAVVHIPGISADSARWVLEDTGSWGVADWRHNTVYIAPRTPQSKLYSVVVHEWSHLQSVRAYGGDVGAAVTAMRAYYGGTRRDGVEIAADCMARLQGATWTNYTPCRNARWMAGARRLLAGRTLGVTPTHCEPAAGANRRYPVGR